MWFFSVKQMSPRLYPSEIEERVWTSGHGLYHHTSLMSSAACKPGQAGSTVVCRENQTTQKGCLQPFGSFTFLASSLWRPIVNNTG